MLSLQGVSNTHDFMCLYIEISSYKSAAISQKHPHPSARLLVTFNTSSVQVTSFWSCSTTFSLSSCVYSVLKVLLFAVVPSHVTFSRDNFVSTHTRFYFSKLNCKTCQRWCQDSRSGCHVFSTMMQDDRWSVFVLVNNTSNIKFYWNCFTTTLWPLWASRSTVF